MESTVRGREPLSPWIQPCLKRVYLEFITIPLLAKSASGCSFLLPILVNIAQSTMTKSDCLQPLSGLHN